MKEGDFGKIRGAVEMQAELFAGNELLEKPLERHYKQAFEGLRGINNIDPNYSGELISYLSGLKELKTRMGPEKYSEFMSIFKEYDEKTKAEREQGLKQIGESELERDKMASEMIGYFKRWIERNNQQLKSDERIRALFAGEEEMLDDALNLLSEKTEKLIVAGIDSAV